MQTPATYKLDRNKNYYTFLETLLTKIVMYNKSPGTKCKDYKCFERRLTPSSLGKFEIHAVDYNEGCSRARREVVQEVRVLERLLGRYPRIRLVIQLLT